MTSKDYHLVQGDTVNPCAMWHGERYLGTLYYHDIERGGKIPNARLGFFDDSETWINRTRDDVDWGKLVPYLVSTGKVSVISGEGGLQFSTNPEEHHWVSKPPLFLFELMVVRP